MTGHTRIKDEGVVASNGDRLCDVDVSGRADVEGGEAGARIRTVVPGYTTYGHACYTGDERLPSLSNQGPKPRNINVHRPHLLSKVCPLNLSLTFDEVIIHFDKRTHAAVLAICTLRRLRFLRGVIGVGVWGLRFAVRGGKGKELEVELSILRWPLVSGRCITYLLGIFSDVVGHVQVIPVQ